MSKHKVEHSDFTKRCEPLFSAVIADVLDTLGYKHQSPRIQLLPLTGVPKLVGRCKTTLWADIAHEDPHTYDLELKAVDSCRAGEVLIAAAKGSMRSGIWGELLSTAASNSECVGAIIDGAVRDVPQMTQMGFGVFARGTCVYDSLNRQKVIEFDVPVEIEGVCFNPGDLVFADVDGIVVVPQKVESQVIELALQKVNSESEVRQAIQGGMKAMAAWEKYGVL